MQAHVYYMKEAGRCRRTLGFRQPGTNSALCSLGTNGAKVWIDVVKMNKAEIWLPSTEIECMGDALGTCTAWPKEKVILC